MVKDVAEVFQAFFWCFLSYRAVVVVLGRNKYSQYRKKLNNQPMAKNVFWAIFWCFSSYRAVIVIVVVGRKK